MMQTKASTIDKGLILKFFPREEDGSNRSGHGLNLRHLSDWWAGVYIEAVYNLKLELDFSFLYCGVTAQLGARPPHCRGF
jgi:hypothetical protein